MALATMRPPGLSAVYALSISAGSPSSPDEDGVWRGQCVERGLSLAGHDFQPWHAELGGVARGTGGAQRIALDADGLG